jgi:Ca2+-binding EF-hand superfamily protein
MSSFSVLIVQACIFLQMEIGVQAALQMLVKLAPGKIVTQNIRCFLINDSLFTFQEIIGEIDEDGSGELEFPEFIQLAAKFLIEEDEEQMRWELREAFRLYDKHGKFKVDTVFVDRF